MTTPLVPCVVSSSLTGSIDSIVRRLSSRLVSKQTKLSRISNDLLFFPSLVKYVNFKREKRPRSGHHNDVVPDQPPRSLT